MTFFCPWPGRGVYNFTALRPRLDRPGGSNLVVITGVCYHCMPFVSTPSAPADHPACRKTSRCRQAGSTFRETRNPRPPSDRVCRHNGVRKSRQPTSRVIWTETSIPSARPFALGSSRLEQRGHIAPGLQPRVGPSIVKRKIDFSLERLVVLFIFYKNICFKNPQTYSWTRNIVFKISV